ncbi:MAG: hypothetical protein ACR2P1_09715 [Pseudomonadales bacterium]
MNLSKILGIAMVAAFAMAEANAAQFGSDNFLAPTKGSSRGAAGWLIDPSAVPVNLGGSGLSAAGQSNGVEKAISLAAGQSGSADGRHLASGFFKDNFSLTLSEDAAVSVSLKDQARGSLFNIDNLSLSLMDAAGNLVAQAGEGESFITSMLLKGEYTVSVTGLSQAVKGGVYSAQLQSIATPIPAAAWLFGSALAVMVGMTRRRKA